MASMTSAPVRRPERSTRPHLAATPTVISAFGIVVALAGVEHGVGEILQGNTTPAGLLIESWPDTPAFEILSGEPAMTVVPNLLVSGILTVLASIVFGAWAVLATRRRHGGVILLGLSLLLLLVGGGLGPPLIGVFLGIAAIRATSASEGRPGPIRRVLARGWRVSTVVGIAGYLALMPGVVLLSHFADVESAVLVSVFGALAFGGLLLALPGALAADAQRDRRSGTRDTKE